MAAPKEILSLIERFNRSREAYLSGEYNETQLRREFLDPFFTALGWDVDNKQGFAEPYKDVVHEDAIKIGTVTKAPDYSFRIGGVRKFFVEAKKPSVNVKEDISPAYQLRRYAWSAKLPLSILTDFEEFAVYDCRVRPLPTDKSSTNRTMYLKCTDYETKWDEIADVFSKDAVLKGSFDKYAETNKAKRGTAGVDDAFLHEIEEWRTALAANIALRNADLSQRELNFAVQRTIDRIIFLRICEDRGIETYGALMSLQNSERIYKRLIETFHRADERYNSGLFHIRPEKERNEPPDEMTLGLDIDDKPLKEIIKSLYYPQSPYEFSVLPADILGQVYEQFLGKVIRLTAGHRAVVEDKPEVKKAGGVYYTPTYIVEYIVKNTVGRLLGNFIARSEAPLGRATKQSDSSKREIASLPSVARNDRMTPKQVSRLRILDPACGSGSFLIGAYQYLLDWHRDWYMKDGPEKWAKGKNPALYQAMRPSLAEDPPPHLRRGQGGGAHWRLTTTERKRILLNNIYGVDIDAQAVETTKLSLLLKVLEGENEQTISRQFKMFHERALPDLGSNIKCGNSLIGPDFYTDDLFSSVGAIRESPLRGSKAKSMDDNERMRINAFDWKTEFPEVFTPDVGGPVRRSPAGRDEGGFDAVIGNPPYIRIQTMKEWAPIEVEAYKKLYKSAGSGNYDIYVVFVEKGLSLLNPKGVLGFILPHKFFNAQYGEPLRELISKGKHLSHVVHFGDQQVFEGAMTYTCLMFLDKKSKEGFDFVGAADILAWRNEERAVHNSVSTKDVGPSEWNFTVGESAALFDKLAKMPTKLGDLAEKIFQGLITGADDVFVLRNTRPGRYFSEATQEEHRIENALMHPLCKGSVNIRRYRIDELTKSILFPYELVAGNAHLLTSQELSERHPLAWAYLQTNRKILEARERGKWKHEKWYALGRSQNLSEMNQKKILTPSIASFASYTLDSTDFFYFVGSGGGGGGGYGVVLNPKEKLSYEYVLGLLNSTLLDSFLKSYSSRFSGGYYAFNRQYIERLPICTINFSDPAAKSRHDKMVGLVEQMLELNKKLAAAKLDHEKNTLHRQIDATDKQIDELVYELYGLNEEERRIVEGS